MSAPAPCLVDELAARQVLLVQAFEQTDDDPLWTPEDRAWATRCTAQDGVDAQQAPGAWLSARARHALQRLLPRQPGLQALLQPGGLSPALAALVLLGALLTGGLVDRIGPDQRIDLLAVSPWLLVLWSLLVAATWLAQAAGLGHGVLEGTWNGLRRRLAALASASGRPPWVPPRTHAQAHATSGTPAPTGSTAAWRFAQRWAQLAAPQQLLRGRLLLHGAAAALALGLVAGLYARGLVLDYRAGWQSTFLTPAAVQQLLAVLLAPASALTGIAVPDSATLATLRAGPDGTAQAPAAPWLHLQAATLALFVIGPRLLLAVVAGWQLHRLRQRWPLPVHEPELQRLLRRAGRRGPALLQLLPHAAALSAPVLHSLQALAAQALGPDARLHDPTPLAYGDEDRPWPPAPPGTTLRALVVDLATTPEAEVHGRLLQQARAGQSAPALPGGVTAGLSGRVPCVLLVDAHTLRQRWAAQPDRLQARCAAWQQLATQHGLPLVCADLAQPTAADRAALAALFEAG